MGEILAAVDGSRASIRAVPLACMLARATNSELLLLRVVELTVGSAIGPRFPELEESAMVFLQKLAWSIRELQGLDATTLTRVGFAPDVIVSEAKAREVSFVVMATHSREGLTRKLLGSVPETVLSVSPVPVFLVPARAGIPRAAPPSRVLVPLDGSKLAEAIVPATRNLASRFGAQVLLLRVFQPSAGRPELPQFGQLVDDLSAAEFAAQAARTRHAQAVSAAWSADLGSDKEGAGSAPEATVSEEFDLGDPATQILRSIEKERIGILALATHGRSGLANPHLSDVALTVLRHSPVPVLAFGRETLRRLVSQDAAAQVSAQRQRRPVPA